MPKTNMNTEEIIKGITTFFSCLYKPGEKNYQIRKRVKGKLIQKAQNSSTFKGPITGAITLTESNCVP